LQPREIGIRKDEVAEPVISRQRQQTVPENGEAQDTSGVWKTARSDGQGRNRRGPTQRPTSGEGGLYKPEVAKGGRAGRESEGSIVPSRPRDTSAAEGSDPALVVPTDGGKHEGMPARANDPTDKVRRLQGRLFRVAKHSRTRRFHALYDRIYRGDVLREAWERVKANRGAAGIDGETLSMIEQEGVEEFLQDVQRRLRTGRYWPQPVRRQYIPKPDGTKRPLGIPTVRDRIVQAATKLVIEPIFEADFKGCSYGFRPKRSATDALEAIRLAVNRGCRYVVDGDIRRYFDEIDQEKLLKLVERRISDRRVLKLLRMWLRAGVMEEGKVQHAILGTPQGGVISPLLANIYLDALDGIWERRCRDIGMLVRYCDDFVVLCRTKAQADEAYRRLGLIMERLSLTLHPEKTRIVELGLGKQGFVFLGCYLRVVLSHFKRREYLFRWPAPRAMKRIRGRIRELTDRRRWSGMKNIKEVIGLSNPVLRGWGNYFRTGNASLKFQQVDRYVNERLVRLIYRHRRHWRRPFHDSWWTPAHFAKLGLHRLVGTIRYPAYAQAT
jgi:group II intron reverse transcriptase/maturase